MIFVDTAAWVAISLKNDQFHRAAAKFQLQLRRSKEELLTSNFILDETYTVLLYQSDYANVVRFYNHMLVMIRGGILRVFHVTEEIEGEAWEVFKRFNQDKQWSFTDCTSKVIMDVSAVSEVFTFDRNFGQMGFICSPTVIKE